MLFKNGKISLPINKAYAKGIVGVYSPSGAMERSGMDRIERRAGAQRKPSETKRPSPQGRDPGFIGARFTRGGPLSGKAGNGPKRCLCDLAR